MGFITRSERKDSCWYSGNNNGDEFANFHIGKNWINVVPTYIFTICKAKPCMYVRQTNVLWTYFFSLHTLPLLHLSISTSEKLNIYVVPILKYVKPSHVCM
jgi:hypothetical protein